MKMGIKINATLSGDDKIIEKLKSKGITQPINVELLMNMGLDIKTGNIKPDGMFPLNADYKFFNLSGLLNGNKIPIPTQTNRDIKMTYRISKDGSIKIDSIGGKGGNDTSQIKMQQMINLVQKEIKFPEKPMKIGDSFSQDFPIPIPILNEGNNKINAGITYKLISVSDGKAFFDVVHSLSINFNIKETTINLTGRGTGKMVYSIKDNFSLSQDIIYDLKVKVASTKFNVDGSAAINLNYIYKIN